MLLIWNFYRTREKRSDKKIWRQVLGFGNQEVEAERPDQKDLVARNKNRSD